MIQGETEVTEFKPKSLQVMECLNADLDVYLFSKTIVSVVGDKHHRHPVITGVTRNLFSRVENWFTRSDFTSFPSSNRA
jgi:hypothetical protein